MAQTPEQVKERMAKMRAKQAEKRAERAAAKEAVAVTNDAPSEPIAKKQRSPWKPARVLDIPAHLKDPRYRYRFCDTGRTGNIQKKIQEGWEIDRELGRKLNEIQGLNTTINDGSPIDSTVRLRELIVMRIPREMAEERNAYYLKRADLTSRAVKDGLHKETLKSREETPGKWGDDSVVVYGDYKETRGG